MAFAYKLEKKKGVVVIEMTGRLVDKVEAIDAGSEIEEALNAGSRHFIIDLSGLEYMNSTGLNILLNLVNKAKANGGDTVISGAPPRIKSLFDVTKLSSIFKLSNNLDEANAVFAKSE